MTDMAEHHDNATTETRRQSWLDLEPVVYVKVAMLALALYMVFKGQIYGMVTRWNDDSNWSHGFIIPLFSLYFLNQKKDELINTIFKPSYLGLVFLILALATYWLTLTHLRYSYAQELSVIFAAGAVVLFMGGWKLVKYTWLPVVFLIFAIPLPQSIYFKISHPMQELAALGSGYLLSLLPSIETAVTGVIIAVEKNGEVIKTGPLNVAEACSGMRLLMAFFALGVAMAYMHYRPWWQRFVLLLSTIPIAIGCNVVRVTITGLIYIFGNPEYAQGIWHDMLGLAMLPLAFALYGGLAALMNMQLFIEEDDSAGKDNVIVRKRVTSSGVS